MRRSSAPAKKLLIDPKRVAFGERLKAVIRERGWTLTETARQVRQQLPDGATFTQANISHYVSGRSLPRPAYLQALSAALHIDAGDLIHHDAPPQQLNGPQSEHPPVEQRQEATPALHIQDLGNRVWLQINQELPWPVALELLHTLKGTIDPEAA